MLTQLLEASLPLTLSITLSVAVGMRATERAAGASRCVLCCSGLQM